MTSVNNPVGSVNLNSGYFFLQLPQESLYYENTSLHQPPPGRPIVVLDMFLEILTFLLEIGELLDKVSDF